MRMKKFMLAAAALAIVAIAPISSRAQSPSLTGPYNTDLGAVITNALRTAGTVNSAAQITPDKNGVVCSFLQTAISGSPSITFAVQGYDAATAAYNTLATSATITTSTTQRYDVIVYPGAVATSVPTGAVIAGIPLPRQWRVQQVVAGTGGPATTGHVGCNALK